MRLGLIRIIAWCIDWLCILGWVALTALIGIPLYLTGIIHTLDPIRMNVIAAIVTVAPVVAAAAWFESRPSAATPGKRATGLRVVATSTGRPRFLTTIARNALKIGVPWLIGHAAVFAIVSNGTRGEVPGPVLVLTAAAYLIPLAWITSLFILGGRTPYDRATHVTVEARSPRSQRR